MSFGPEIENIGVSALIVIMSLKLATDAVKVVRGWGTNGHVKVNETAAQSDSELCTEHSVAIAAQQVHIEHLRSDVGEIKTGVSAIQNDVKELLKTKNAAHK